MSSERDYDRKLEGKHKGREKGKGKKDDCWLEDGYCHEDDEIYEDDECHKEEHYHKDNEYHKEEHCHKDCECNNGDECYKDGHETKHRKDKCCHGTWHCDDILEEEDFPRGCKPVKSGLTDVVNSIAHQENGLANILEKESKKICKAIGVAKSIDDLIKIDKSVQDTIKQINSVQILLLSKLQEVSDICEGCKEDSECECE